MNFIRRMFKRKVFRGNGQREPRPLRIEGVKTAMTPQPDDAELAAQALLESKKHQSSSIIHQPSSHQPSDVHDVAYYKQLSERIKASRAAEARMTMRYLAYCEDKLKMYDGRRMTDDVESQSSAVAEMERGLYKRQTIAEREGGELLRRWQHCLAEVIVRQMPAESETNAE